MNRKTAPRKKHTPPKNRSPLLKSVGFVIKTNQPEAQSLAQDLVGVLHARNIKVVFNHQDKALAKNLPGVSVVHKDKLPEHCDLIIVLGGDGTYLSAARLMKKKSIPILGVNMGTLGFLTEIRKEEVFDAVHAIFVKGELKISERALLGVRLERAGKVLLDSFVVNDAVISKGAIARIIGVKISVDGRFANTIRADGIIVSTPTGSTAYSLAAGGPIVMPTLNALQITPICPHGLNQRPVMLPDTAKVELTLNHMPGHVYLTLDGQEGVDLKEGDRITVSRAQGKVLKIVNSPHRDYFLLLREKLSFGGSPREA